MMELKNIDLTNKCGSCDYFNPIDGTAMGECRKNPYDENVVHDPKHPYWIVARSRIKCRAYKSHYNKPQPTNADRIRAMSDEEKSREFVFFCPSDTAFWGEDTYGKPHYTGLDGKYYSTSDEVIHANMKWLKQPAQEE